MLFLMKFMCWVFVFRYYLLWLLPIIFNEKKGKKPTNVSEGVTKKNNNLDGVGKSEDQRCLVPALKNN